MGYLFTSESVSEGHPDKVADQISDAVLDKLLAFDPSSKVACETLVTTGQVVLAGEVKTKAYVDLQRIAREVINRIGYTKSEYMFEGNSCGVFSAIHEQSADINRGVEREDPMNQGAGDQGMMFGYATNETENYMPLSLDLAHRILQVLADIRREGKVMTYLRPDAKSQVTIEYDDNGKPVRIDTIVVSTQHDDFVAPADDSKEAQLKAVEEMLDKILGPMDRELSEMLQVEYAKRGVKFYLGHKVPAVNGGDVTVEKDGETSVIQGEKVLLSVGRHPVPKGFGLETLAPEPFRNGSKVNGFMQTSVPNVYACGDITAFSLLAHTAVSEAEVAVDHILGKNRSMSYKAIPGVVYPNPEIAGVGKPEEELQAEGTPYTVKKIPMAFSGRFVAENEQGNGVCKLILAEDETIIGAHLLGNPASELIVIAGIAVEKGMKASELKSIVFPHPTVGEILKEAL